MMVPKTPEKFADYFKVNKKPFFFKKNSNFIQNDKQLDLSNEINSDIKILKSAFSYSKGSDS